MNGTVMIPYALSFALNRPQITARMNVYALVLVLPASALLIHFFGLAGAGLSWLTYNVFIYCYSIPRISKECLHLPTLQWYRHMLKVALLGVLSYGVCFLILSFTKSQSILVVALLYLLGSGVFLYGAYFLIGKELKDSLNYYARLFSMKFLHHAS